MACPVLIDYSHSLEVFHGLIGHFGAQEVLKDLVFPFAEPGLLLSHLGKRLCISDASLADVFCQFVDVRL